ncbi:MAG TPA: hypothetical protein DCL48_17285 [Alphaproteobacteria bacterium]|nr:hypothetical protein [Alphaproteobacteria bacterium]
MIQELAITASIGVALKIITNLVMLPIVASFFKYPENFVERVNAARDARIGAIRFLGNVANPAIAFPVFIGYLVLFGIAVNESEKRHVGDLHPGAPELRQDERYNVDSRLVAQKFSVGLDLLTVIVETPPLACVNYNYMKHLNEFSWFLRNQPGVRDVQSLPFVAKQINSGWNEGNLKFRDLPRNQFALVQATSPVGTSSGLLDVDCTLLPIQVYLIDGKAETIKPVVAAVKAWIEERGHKPVLSAGTFNSDKVIPVEFLPGGRVKRESSDPTSSWTLTREQLVNLRYNAPPLGEIKPLQFRVEGFAEISADGMPKGDPIAKGTVKVNPDETGAAGVDILSNIRGTEWDNAAHFLIRDVPDGLLIRLASGNSGVAAAVNEEISKQELPTTLAVYAVIIILVFFTYWDWRATVCCCLPLTFATFFGYWFMLNTEIGLKVSTLPVMVLAVGIGVDYAFYIYNRLQYHLSVGLNVTESYKQAITETGNAVIFTAVTLAIGVSTWSFSPLKFQADMGLLLTFMFVINMLMAITALPAMAVVLETLIPRKTRPWAPPGGH